MSAESAKKFDAARAADYDTQVRIALAGYDACHELAACMLAVALGSGTEKHLVVVGAGGTGSEIVTAGRLEPRWRFTAVDPSGPMLDLALSRLARDGMADRTEAHLGTVDDLPAEPVFDAATLMGVFHHLRGDAAKRAILAAIAARLKPGAPLILAGNRFAYESQPVLLAAWAERWRLHGTPADEIQAKLGTMTHAADPPGSEEIVAEMLDEAGFEQPLRFFASLFWSAWMTRRR